MNDEISLIPICLALVDLKSLDVLSVNREPIVIFASSEIIG